MLFTKIRHQTDDNGENGTIILCKKDGRSSAIPTNSRYYPCCKAAIDAGKTEATYEDYRK